MNLIIDLIKIVFARWANCKKFIVFTIINLTVGLCILTFFVNIGYNISSYISSRFLTDERLQHVLVYSNKNTQIPIDIEFLNDEQVDSYRLIYDSNVDVQTVGGVNYADTIYLDMTIMESSDILFENEYMSNTPFKEKTADWKSGVILSEKCLAIFDGENPLGKEVCFSYNGVSYKLPVTGIIASKAEENYDFDYKSFMYIFASNLSSLPPEFETVDLRINDLTSVERFVNTYTKSSYKMISSIEDIHRLLGLKLVVNGIFIITGIIFLLLTSLGIINSLSSMQDKTIKNISLTKIIGFSNIALLLINLIESIILGLISSFTTITIFFMLLFFMRNNYLFHFEFINIDDLLSVNHILLVICMVAFFVIIFICNLIVLKKVKEKNIIDILKSE